MSDQCDGCKDMDWRGEDMSAAHHSMCPALNTHFDLECTLIGMEEGRITDTGRIVDFGIEFSDGTFTVTAYGQTSRPLPHDATPEEISSAIEGLRRGMGTEPISVESVMDAYGRGEKLITINAEHPLGCLAEVYIDGELQHRCFEVTVSPDAFSKPVRGTAIIASRRGQGPMVQFPVCYSNALAKEFPYEGLWAVRVEGEIYLKVSDEDQEKVAAILATMRTE